jgi:hypothetical protein
MLNEITKEILKDDGCTFSLSEIKAVNEIVEDSIEGNYFYCDTQKYTARSFLIIDKDRIDNVFRDWIIDLADECYLSDKDKMVKRYFDYDKFIDDCMIDGYAHTFNSYDGYTELETDQYYIYYHN